MVEFNHIWYICVRTGKGLGKIHRLFTLPGLVRIREEGTGEVEMGLDRL